MLFAHDCARGVRGDTLYHSRYYTRDSDYECDNEIKYVNERNLSKFSNHLLIINGQLSIDMPATDCM